MGCRIRCPPGCTGSRLRGRSRQRPQGTVRGQSPACIASLRGQEGHHGTGGQRQGDGVPAVDPGLSRVRPETCLTPEHRRRWRETVPPGRTHGRVFSSDQQPSRQAAHSGVRRVRDRLRDFAGFGAFSRVRDVGGEYPGSGGVDAGEVRRPRGSGVRRQRPRHGSADREESRH